MTQKGYVSIIIIGMELDSLLASALVKEFDHSITSIVWGYGGRLQIYIYIY